MASYYAQGMPLHAHPGAMQQPQQQFMDPSSYAHATAATYNNSNKNDSNSANSHHHSNTSPHEPYADAYGTNHVGHNSGSNAGVFAIPAPEEQHLQAQHQAALLQNRGQFQVSEPLFGNPTAATTAAGAPSPPQRVLFVYVGEVLLVCML